PGQVPGDLPGAHREPGEHDVIELQVLEQRVEVGGKGVVVVADGRLAGTAEPPSVVADDSVAVGQQRTLLALPRVAVQRIAVDKDDRRTGAVVLVVDLDWCVVLRPYCDARHCGPPMSGM